MHPESDRRGLPARPASQPMADLAPAASATRVLAVPSTGHHGPPQVQGPPPNSMGLLRALRRRSALALGIAILGASIAGPAAWFIIPTSYKAQALLHIDAKLPKLLFNTVETSTGEDYKRFQTTQQTLVKSQMVLTKALADPTVRGYRLIAEEVDPIEWLQQKLKVDFAAGSEVMEISLSGSNPAELAGIVNAVKKAYMDEVVNKDLKRRLDRWDFLKKLKVQYGDQLKKKRDIMRKLAETIGSDNSDALALRQQYAIEYRHYLQKELIDVKAQRRRIEAQLRFIRGEAEPSETVPIPTEREIDALVEEHPAVSQVADLLADREQQLDAEIANVSRVSRQPHSEPSVTALKSSIKNLRVALDRRRKEVRPEVVRESQHRDVADPAVRDLRRDAALLADMERELEDEFNRATNEHKDLTHNTLDLRDKQTEVAQMESAAAKIAEEVEALGIEIEAPKRIITIDDATTPRTASDKKRYMMVAMVTLGMFFGGLFGVAFLEMQTHKVDSADDVPAELGLAVVGALPILPARNRQGGALVHRPTEKDRYWRNMLLESVDATRTLLMHAARTGSHRVILITSAVGGEGKTSLSSYLATSLARSGQRTLLVDADLRSPMMHRLFELPQEPGLSELLRGEVDLDEAVAATSVEDLKLLSAGQCDRQALRILSQGGLAALFDRFKQSFDFVIVDSSPILPVADAMLIAQHADAALFSILRDVSRKTKVKAAVERLQRLGVPVLGAVVTGADSGLYGNTYYYESGSPETGLPETASHSS